METAIRAARLDDAPDLAALTRAAYGMYIERIGREPAPMQADYDRLIRREVVWVLDRAGRTRGVIVMWPRGDHLFIENVAVHPDDQGHGLGRELMAFADEHARRLELRAIELYTNEAMTENVAFYGRLGFIETDRRDEDGFRRVFMRKTLR